MRRASTIALLLLLASSAPSAQTPSTIPEMWNAWCARCHAQDGSGRVPDRPVLVDPMDFTDCRVASPEPDADWALAIRAGGPAVGLSPEMPAFGETLTAEQVQGFVDYIRGLCTERGWPHGNLNFPRPIFTEKAFPENELVILPMAAHEPENGTQWSTRVVYERRAGRRTQLEASIPVGSDGVGNLEVAAKRVLATSVANAAILSGGLEVVFPTARSSGNTTVFEPYLAAGMSRGAAYLQSQIKLELPARGARALIYNAYAGRDLSETPDTWTVGVELNGENRELAITPQIRKGLTRTGALGAALGARLPINYRDRREIQWVGYLLWEYLEPVRAAR